LQAEEIKFLFMFGSVSVFKTSGTNLLSELIFSNLFKVLNQKLSRKPYLFE
jgi:hypothetical protein